MEDNISTGLTPDNHLDKIKDKYYVPKIEEFHVGFEYVVLQFLETVLYDPKSGKITNNPKSVFIEVVWNEHSNMKDAFNVTYYTMETFPIISVPDSIKVKYLDKEDIESFGFKYDKTSGGGQLKFFKDNICLVYRPETNEILTFTVDPSKNDYMMKYALDNKTSGILNIKNKSELKRLLQWLDIINPKKKN